jgi:hypothetical protein
MAQQARGSAIRLYVLGIEPKWILKGGWHGGRIDGSAGLRKHQISQVVKR